MQAISSARAGSLGGRYMEWIWWRDGFFGSRVGPAEADEWGDRSLRNEDGPEAGSPFLSPPPKVPADGEMNGAVLRLCRIRRCIISYYYRVIGGNKNMSRRVRERGSNAE
jgi:hypothetical protein